MPKNTMAAHIAVTIDGEVFELVTKPGDLVSAEHWMRREKIANPTESAPILLQTRLVFAAFGRRNPDHPAARDWPKFLEAVDDLVQHQEDDDDPEPLDPTRSEDSSIWP